MQICVKIDRMDALGELKEMDFQRVEEGIFSKLKVYERGEYIERNSTYIEKLV